MASNQTIVTKLQELSTLSDELKERLKQVRQEEDDLYAERAKLLKKEGRRVIEIDYLDDWAAESVFVVTNDKNFLASLPQSEGMLRMVDGSLFLLLETGEQRELEVPTELQLIGVYHPDSRYL